MTVSLQEMLRQRKDFFLNRWFERVLGEYDGETASFLKSREDRFANPVAYALREAMEEIYQALLDHRDVDQSPLKYVMKIKAVQESDPIRGIGFIHFLKEIVRKAVAGSVPEKELEALDVIIDRIAKTASELFISNRAKIAEISATSRMI